MDFSFAPSWLLWTRGLGLLIALFFALAPQPVEAQAKWRRGVVYLYVFGDEQAPAKLVAAAYAQPYGQAVIAHFASVMGDTADPACLTSKGLAKQQVVERARAFLPERGVYMVERHETMVDQAKFKDYLRARIGREGLAEFERLRGDPIVKAFMGANEPALLAEVASHVAENLARYALIMRIKFARSISPVEADIPSVEKVNPIPNVDVTLNRMIADDKSGTLERYLKLIAFAQQPHRDATNMDIARQFGPGDLLARPGKDREELHDALVQLCVASCGASAGCPRIDRGD
jgi:hypothetical protein